MLERLFRLRENATSVRIEVIAGSTTFLSMSYIIFVQPALLASIGMDFGAVMMATCLSSALACMIMAFAANYPIALAPGMGENFYFAYAVVLGMGISWQTALGAVFLSGIIFLILTLLHVREMIIDAIPENLKHAIPAAIGLFISFLGLIQAGIIVKASGDAVITLGDMHSPPTLLSLAGLLIILLLMVRNVKGAMLLGMLATALIGLFTGVIHYNGIFSPPPSIAPTFLQLDIPGAIDLGIVTVLMMFLIMDMFDTIGTFIGVGQATGMMKDGTMPRVQQALLADAAGTIFGALFGTSTVTSYMESTTGVREGGRTGLTSLTTAVLFISAIFFSPLVSMVGSGYPVLDGDGNTLHILYPVTAPALILVGSYMAKSLGKCRWDDMTEAIPAFMTILIMMTSLNISHGLAAGFILYPVMKVIAGRPRDISWLMYIVAGVFILRYVIVGA